jgi:hypothetical protein
MTPTPNTLAALGCIDIALLVLSYLMYRRIRDLSERFQYLTGSS